MGGKTMQDDVAKGHINSFLLTTQTQKELQNHDERLNKLTKQIDSARTKRDFFQKFAEDPNVGSAFSLSLFLLLSSFVFSSN